ncbi:MAG: hypothetical protein LQ337_008585 [Flavoplaca oasis]|nr:MAG: hypothetical protein LQ337_008585 [Flavoplaca oasis]
MRIRFPCPVYLPGLTSHVTTSLSLTIFFLVISHFVLLAHPAPTAPPENGELVIAESTLSNNNLLTTHRDERQTEEHEPQSITALQTLQPRQAGLAWGPVTVANLKLYLTNPHIGYAGPKFPSAEHVNFHIDRADAGPRGTYSSVVNMHIVKYGLAGNEDGSGCIYAWDSVTKKVVFDECADEYLAVMRKCVQAVKDFVDALVKNANFVVRATMTVALAALLAVLTVLASSVLG